MEENYTINLKWASKIRNLAVTLLLDCTAETPCWGATTMHWLMLLSQRWSALKKSTGWHEYPYQQGMAWTAQDERGRVPTHWAMRGNHIAPHVCSDNAGSRGRTAVLQLKTMAAFIGLRRLNWSWRDSIIPSTAQIYSDSSWGFSHCDCN